MPEATSIYTPSPSDVAVPPSNLRPAIRNCEVAAAARCSLTWPALMRALPVEADLGGPPNSMTPVLAILLPLIADVARSALSSTRAVRSAAPSAAVSVMAALSARLLTKRERRTVAVRDDLLVLART